MPIAVGDKIPNVKIKTMGESGPEDLSTGDFFAGKTVAMFALPGAFTPTCSAKHLPGFVQNFDALQAKGVDAVGCLSVNDAFVMGAWGEQQGAGGKVTMMADGNGEFAKALGLEFDASGFGMGVRSQRFALIARDGVVSHLAIEEPGAFEISSAEALLRAL